MTLWPHTTLAWRRLQAARAELRYLRAQNRVNRLHADYLIKKAKLIRTLDGEKV